MNFFALLELIFSASGLERALVNKLLGLGLNRPAFVLASKKLDSLKTNLARTLKTSPTQIFENLLLNPEKVSILLNEAGKDGRKLISDLINEAQQDLLPGGSDFALLNSSWIESGEFVPTAGTSVGELTITTKEGKSYTYPSVSLAVWNAMKGAKGSNGSGAGTVFWTLYLRGYQKSPIRQALSIGFSRLAQGGI